MLYFHKFVEFSKAVYYIAKNYLPLLQQIDDSLKKIGSVGTLPVPVCLITASVDITAKSNYPNNLANRKQATFKRAKLVHIRGQN